MNKNKSLLFLAILMTNLSFCSSSGDGLAGMEQKIVVNSDNDNLTIEVDDPSVDGDVSVAKTFEGESPSAPSTELPNPSNDDDGDGILDGQDNIPNLCTKMVVTSNGVSTGKITLNDDELYSPTDFDNKDFSKATVINLKNGDNHLRIKVGGSFGDQLNVRFYNCSESPSELVYQTTVTRITEE